MPATKTKTKPATGKGTASKVWTEAERDAMKERAKELKAARGKQDGAADLQAKIAEMPEPDRSMAKRIHEIVTDTAPDLAPKTWYGMPAWADAEGKIVAFFTPAVKFKERFATFGFNAPAHLDDGDMWPTSFALLKLTPKSEAMIADLVKRAVS